MSSQGPNSPGTFNGDYNEDGDSWLNTPPSTSWLWNEDSPNSQGLLVTNFDFSIPAGATITSVVAAITRDCEDAGDVQDYIVQLVVGGSPTGPNKAATSTNWPTSAGGASYTWNIPSDLSLSVAQANASNFGWVIAAQSADDLGNATIQGSSMTLTINYTGGGGGGAGSAGWMDAIAGTMVASNNVNGDLIVAMSQVGIELDYSSI